MAFSQSDLSELLDALRAGGDIDLIRSSVEMVLQALIDAEASVVIGAELHERTDTRTNQRNGTRPRLLATKAGDVELAIPKLRHGSFFPTVRLLRASPRGLGAIEHFAPSDLSATTSGCGCRPVAHTARFVAAVGRKSCAPLVGGPPGRSVQRAFLRALLAGDAFFLPAALRAGGAAVFCLAATLDAGLGRAVFLTPAFFAATRAADFERFAGVGVDGRAFFFAAAAFAGRLPRVLPTIMSAPGPGARLVSPPVSH